MSSASTSSSANYANSELNSDSQNGPNGKPLNICLLGYRSHPYGGGQGVYLRYLSKALADLGHTVDVISGEPYPHLEEGVRLIKLPGLNLYENGLSSLRLHHLSSWANIVEWCSKLTGGFAEPYSFGRRVNAYLKKHGQHYDVIHDNQSLSYGMLAIQKRQPLVMTIHHPITSDFRIAHAAGQTWGERLLIKRWYSFLKMQKKVAQRLEHIITVSDCSRKDIAEDFELPESRIEVLYNGIDTNKFKPVPGIKRSHQRIMATASADAPMKGLAYLLKAYAQLLKDYPDLELMVVGKPKEDGDTEKLLKKLKLVDKVQFVSGITTTQLVEYYAQATIAVVPSLYEGFGLPAGEAMACGVPLVSTTGGALPEVVGDAGILVEPANEQALASAIDDLLKDPSKREALGVQARQHIEEQFCWDKLAIDMSHYYHRVIDQHTR